MKNTQVNNAKDLDVAMPIQNLLDKAITVKEHQKIYINIVEMNQL